MLKDMHERWISTCIFPLSASFLKPAFFPNREYSGFCPVVTIFSPIISVTSLSIDFFEAKITPKEQFIQANNNLSDTVLLAE